MSAWPLLMTIVGMGVITFAIRAALFLLPAGATTTCGLCCS